MNAQNMGAIISSAWPAPGRVARRRDTKAARYQWQLRLGIRFSLIAFLICIDCVADEMGALDRFKRFLEKRPAINACLFEKELTGVSLPEHLKGAQRQTFFGRWRPDAYYIQAVTDTNAIDAPRHDQIYAGRIRGMVWELHSGDLTTLQGGEAQGQSANDLLAIEGISRSTLETALNLGMPEIKHGSVRWEGNEFYADCESGKVFGQLKVRSGLPVEIALSYTKGGPSYALVKYRYSSNFLEGAFPVEFERYKVINGKEYSEFRIKLFHLDMGSPPIQLSMFEPLRFVPTDKERFFIISNETVYAKSIIDSNAPLQKVYTVAEQAMSLGLQIGKGTGSKHRVVLVSFLVTSFLGAALFVLLYRKNEGKP